MNAITSRTHLAIGTPCYAEYSHEYVESMLALVADCARTSIALSWILLPRISLVTFARNHIVAQFLLRPELTHLLWIDADIGFTIRDVGRLLGADKDVVCGVYPKKAFNAGVAIEALPGGLQIDERGLAEVSGGGTGFMLIRRSVFKKIMESYPKLKCNPDPALPDAGKLSQFHFRFFDILTEPNGKQVGEDLAFCRLWRNLGGKIFCDTRARLTHTGTKIFG